MNTSNETIYNTIKELNKSNEEKDNIISILKTTNEQIYSTIKELNDSNEEKDIIIKDLMDEELKKEIQKNLIKKDIKELEDKGISYQYTDSFILMR